MDRAMAKRHLAEAVAHVELGERTVARQRRVIAQLESDGRDSSAARELLAKLEEMRAMHVAERDRLRSEFAALTP